MTRYIVRRLALSIVTLFLLVTVVFFITNVFPSDPGRTIAGPFAPQATVDDINDRLGTNDPLLDQYGRLLKSVVTFDYGESFVQRQPVNDLLLPALGRSARLVALTLVLTVPLAIWAGMFAARRRNTFVDRTIVTLGVASSSIPEFVSGVILQYLVAIRLGWFEVLAIPPPDAGPLTELRYLILPAIALVIVYFGYIARMTRAGTIAALDADYTRTAVMKGLPGGRVMRGHVARNALQPTVSVVGIQIGYLFSGLIGLELVFQYRGLGLTIYNAVQGKDFPLLSACVIVVGIIYMLTTLLADLIIAWMNPRARLEAARA